MSRLTAVRSLVQLATIVAMCWLVSIDRLSGEWAATAIVRLSGEWAATTIVAVGGFQLQQLVKRKPPTSLVFAVVEGVRHVTNKFA